MMPSDRFDRRLPAILDEISQPRTPDYFDDLLGLTASTRQRPAWTLPERWLPMVDITRQPAFVRQVPWRPIAVLALIILLAGCESRVGDRLAALLPAPFGLARNGLVAYAKAGDIYTADPVTGRPRRSSSGPETDLHPDGRSTAPVFVFERRQRAAPALASLYVREADGSDLIRVTPEPLVGIGRDYDSRLTDRRSSSRWGL